MKKQEVNKRSSSNKALYLNNILNIITINYILIILVIHYIIIYLLSTYINKEQLFYCKNLRVDFVTIYTKNCFMKMSELCVRQSFYWYYCDVTLLFL